MQYDYEADFIVVGSGSSGSVIAARLSEKLGTKVLLIEAGGSDRNLKILMPGLSYTTVYGDPKYDWSYTSEPDPTRHGRRDIMPRGKVLGGTSSINSMSYLRGTKEDFQAWHELGNTGWDFASVLPFFRKLETFKGGGEERGRTGPQPVSRLTSPHPLAGKFIESCKAVGLRYVDDVNAVAASDGVGYTQATQRRGSRFSAARSYLWNAQKRRNLTILTHATVCRVEFEGDVASSVVFRRDGSEHRASARNAVILCAGAYGSPQILMLSGIGPADHLRRVGVEVKVDLPGVGQNLQDHPGSTHTALVKERTYNVMTSPLEKLFIGLQWFMFGTGPASTPVAHAVGALNFDTEQAMSRLQVLFCPGGFALTDDGPTFLDRPAVSGVANVHRPYSSGTVELRSGEVFDDVKIQENLLSDERDVATLVKGHKVLRKIFSSQPIADSVIQEFLPGKNVTTDDEIADFVRRNANGNYHPSSTCKMGVDGMSVVDPRLKVRGVQNLYVVDASVMPFIVSANLSATCMMMAERLADWLSQDIDRQQGASTANAKTVSSGDRL